MGGVIRSRGLAIVVGIVGLGLLVASGFADSFNLGPHGFGWKQTTGVIVGALLLVAAVGMLLVGRRSARASQAS
jgi:peptidoglycan/LPS O-acetylase OafA/YrhL